MLTEAGGRPPERSPEATAHSSFVRSLKESWKADQCSRSRPCRMDSPTLAARRPQAPRQTASFHTSRWWRPGDKMTGIEVPKRRRSTRLDAHTLELQPRQYLVCRLLLE